MNLGEVLSRATGKHRRWAQTTSDDAYLGEEGISPLSQPNRYLSTHNLGRERGVSWKQQNAYIKCLRMYLLLHPALINACATEESRRNPEVSIYTVRGVLARNMLR